MLPCPIYNLMASTRSRRTLNPSVAMRRQRGVVLPATMSCRYYSERLRTSIALQAANYHQ